MARKRCRHSSSWLIASAHYEWCAQCGALRPLVPHAVENSCTLDPKRSWAHPDVEKPPHAFGKRKRKL